MKTRACIWLSPEDRATLEGWVADRNTLQKLVWRSRIVLVSADRLGKMRIVRAVRKCKRTGATSVRVGTLERIPMSSRQPRFTSPAGREPAPDLIRVGMCARA